MGLGPGPMSPHEGSLPGVDPQGFRWFTAAGMGASLAWSAIHLLVGSLGAAVVLTLGALGMWASYALHPRIGYRVAQRISLGDAFAIVLVLTAWTGGLGGVTGIWLFLLPVAAALFLGAREAALWSLGLVAVVIVFAAGEFLGVPFPNAFSPEHEGILSVASRATALVSVVLLSLIYAYGQELALRRLTDSHDELRSAHEKVRGSESRLRDLVRAIEGMDKHVVLGADLGGTIIYAGGTEGPFGIPGRELIGRPLEALGEEVRNAALPASATETLIPEPGLGAARTFEATGRRVDGSSFPLEISTAPILDADQEVEGVVLIGRDRTVEVETQERLLQSSKLASVGELVAGVAHELNNPLTVTITLSSLLEQELEGQAAEDAAAIREQAERASRIVRGLLTFSRRAPVERVQVDLNRLVEGVARKLRAGSVCEGIRIDWELASALLPIEADPLQLEQVLTNLLRNAEQALRDGAEGGRIVVRTRQDGDSLHLTVTDDGPGIDPEVLPRIFDPFVTTRAQGEGTGLGLSVSHGIVTSHGGTIQARSKPGEGAEFSLTFPAAVQRPLHLDSPRDPAEDPSSPPPPLRILVVDDEEPIRRTLLRFLGRRGHTVDAATSGLEAVAKLEDGRYDVVLLDMKMPGMSGEDVFRRLEKRAPDVAGRVIFATGDVVSPDTSAFLESTGRPVIEKPYQLTEIAAAVEGA